MSPVNAWPDPHDDDSGRTVVSLTARPRPPLIDDRVHTLWVVEGAETGRR